MTTVKGSFFDNKIFDFLLVFFLVYLGSNTIVSQVLLSTQLSIVIVAGVLIVLAVFKFRIKTTKTAIRILFILLFLVFFAMIINADTENFFGVFIIAVKILSGYLLFSCFDGTRIMKAFAKVIVIISVASLIVTYVFPVFSIEKLFPTVVNSSGITFFNCILSLKIDSYGYYSSRNYGIFSEPAVFCYYLFLAAVALLFLFTPSWKKYLSLSLVCIAMFTTLSPLGVLGAVVIFVIGIVDMQKSKSITPLKKAGMVLLVLFVVVLLLSNDTVRHNIEFALRKGDLSVGSGEGRMRAIWLDFAYWIRRPFFGRSLETLNKVTNHLGFNTSTTGAMFVSFGLIFGTIVTILQYKSVKFFTHRSGLFVTILIFAVYVIMINNHGYIQCDWYWYFAFIGICGAETNETTDPDIQYDLPEQKQAVHFIK